jgi:hypothetical protein
MTLSSFECLVFGEPHLFIVWVPMDKRHVKDNDVLARILFRWREDGHDLLGLLDSAALLLRWESARNSMKMPHCRSNRPNQLMADRRSRNHRLRGYSPNGHKGLLGEHHEIRFANKPLTFILDHDLVWFPVMVDLSLS